MKYLKKFENKEFKTYAVLEDKLYLTVIKINEQQNKLINLSILYKYDKKTNQLNKTETRFLSASTSVSYTYTKKDFQDEMIYQSDDLQDILDKIPMLSSAYKYNL